MGIRTTISHPAMSMRRNRLPKSFHSFLTILRLSTIVCFTMGYLQNQLGLKPLFVFSFAVFSSKRLSVMKSLSLWNNPLRSERTPSLTWEVQYPEFLITDGLPLRLHCLQSWHSINSQGLHSS